MLLLNSMGTGACTCFYIYLYNFFMKDFKTHEQLIEKLEVLAGFKFSKSILNLYTQKGYRRVKNTLIFMINNNLDINNISIKSVYKNEKHFRHMLMPRIESFEMSLMNNTLHEVTNSLKASDNIFSDTLEKTIFIKEKKERLIHSINKRLKKVYKNDNFDLTNNQVSIYDWFHKLMFGELIFFFVSLRPKIQEQILMKSFGIKINKNTINKELSVIRLLRNRIAHAEQTFSPKDQRLDSSDNPNNYFLCLKLHINTSQFYDIFKPNETYIDRLLVILDKYKK